MTEKCLIMILYFIQQSEEIRGAPVKLKFLLQMIWIGDSLILYMVAALSLSSIYRSLLSSVCRSWRQEANMEQQQQQGLHKWLVSI